MPHFIVKMRTPKHSGMVDFVKAAWGVGAVSIIRSGMRGGGLRPFVPGGVTAVLGNNTGKVSYTVKGWAGGDKVIQVTSYRGLEAPFEYLWMMSDDVLVFHSPASEDARSTVYVCENPAKFTSHYDSDKSIPDGYVSVTDLHRAEGYIGTFSISTNGYSFADAIGGSANKGGCDYFYHPGVAASGWHAILLSAGASAGAYAGFGYLTTSARSSIVNAYLGFRLCRN